MPSIYNARSKQAFEMRREGKTYKEIAIEVGRTDDPRMPISIERARQLVLRHERCLKHLAAPSEMGIYAGLSSRARNILKAERISSKEEALNAIESGSLASFPNCGAKTMNQIKEWALADES